MSHKKILAVDLGAESGRVMQVTFDGTALHMEEVHRFANVPVQTPRRLYWDVLRLWHDITDGLAKVPDAASVGVDTWGVDFALLDKNGELLANPVHYRDPRTDGAMDWFFDRMPRRELFERTGIQFLQLNGLFQLCSLLRDGSPLLDSAETFLTIADLFNYWLTGAKSCEFTHFTTQQLYNPRLGAPDAGILQAAGIPARLFPPIVLPGTHLGQYGSLKVIAPACHDTGSAYVAIPTTTDRFAVLSSGTWSLLGLELPAAVISDAAYTANVTNEGGFGGTWRFLKNIMGLWLVQQSREVWRKQGHLYTYEQLVHMAETAPRFRAFIEPDDPAFFPPGDMPARIREACRRSGQPVPATDADILATIYQSLALKYRQVLDQLLAASGRSIDRLHIIGGGSQNALLCQMTASAIGRPVYAGPVEATALGNALVQMIALGDLGSLAEARTLLSQAASMVVYEPQDVALWEEQYQRFQSVTAPRAG
ncbi:MAG: rhamnulokinase [Anaerolineae bacterium]|jgi:rhamnulokinase|nr:rhamnulokinase [Anaerolineae bacterium]